MVVVASFAIASAAQAAPPTPALIETNPVSSAAAPATSTNPLIVGVGDQGAATKSVPFTPWGSSAATGTRLVEPSEYEIQIFAEAECGGAPVAIGDVATLEKPGIEVTVAEDSVTTFSAKEINPEEPGAPSGCSGIVKYWEGTPPVEEPAVGEEGGGGSEAETPSGGGTSGVGGAVPLPPAAPRLRVLPSSLANHTTPVIAGSAPGAEAVRLYGVANCSGSALARVSPEQLSAGVPVRVAPNAITAFSAVSLGPGGASSCSSPAYYTEDSIRPHTRITMGPASKTRRRVAVFRFTDTTGAGPGTKFFCKVNKLRKWKKWRKCKSPMKFRGLRARRYEFRVRAVDPAGNRDRKPAKRRFKVVRHRG